MPTDWKFPMKPKPVNLLALQRLPLDQYTMELKYDGHRAIAVAEGETVTLWTRNKTKIQTTKELRDGLRALRLPPGTVLDGEIWHTTRRGGWAAGAAEDGECTVTFWDCVRDGMQDVSALPIEERRERLGRLLARAPANMRQVEVMPADLARAAEVEEQARAAREASKARSGNVHGIVFKRNGSPRRDHAVRCAEHPDWLKLVFSGMGGAGA